jgi:gliding motility-associated-like protein
MKQIIASLVFSCLTMFAWAQSEVFNIGSTPDYAGCDAIMHDDNGGLVPYSPDANEEILICSADIVEQVNLFFIGFSLSPGDSLYIYDGFDTTAPLIGAFSGESLLFETISSTDACLYVVFVANGDANVGDFSTRIICGTPCDFPVAIMQGQESNAAPADTIKICPGESVEFDATGSSWTTGATPTYLWDFGDETNATTTGSVDSISHTYSLPGGYRARLRMEDSNNCESLNLPEVIVFVSTPYIFDLTASSTSYCIGNEVLIGTQAYVDTTFIGDEADNGSTITWIEDNSLVFENGIYIPDNQGCLESEIEFTQFGGLTIQNVSNFNSIYFNMEHSYVGDITIRIICPNGQTMSIFPEAGFSSADLGEPIIGEIPNNSGVGYDYSFSPNSTGGTWIDFLAGGGASVIPAGDYEPQGSFEDLIGCPLNGTWTLEVCDIVGVDDGYVFEFGIQFASSLYPELLTFTPIVGNGCDSSYWVNSSLFSSIGENCDWAVFNPSTPGNYTFEYEVVNDFGCVFTDDISIEVVPRPAYILSDGFVCLGSNSTVLAALPFNADYDYSWLAPTGPLSDNDETINVNLSINLDSAMYVLTTDLAGYENCTRVDTAMVYRIPELVTTEFGDSCEAELPLTLTAAAQDPRLAPYVVYTWSKIDDLPYEVVGNGSSLEVTEDGVYELIVTDTVCNTTTTVSAGIAPPLVAVDSQLEPCIEELPFYYYSDNQQQDVIWSWSYIAEVGSGYNDSTDFLIDTASVTDYSLTWPGTYFINVQQNQPGHCQSDSTIQVIFLPSYCPVLIPNIMTPNGDGENDTFNVTNIGRLAGSTCQIFNRWGNLVFEDKDYDGSWSAVDLPDGVYYYVIGVKRGSGFQYFSGDLTILR